MGITIVAFPLWGHYWLSLFNNLMENTTGGVCSLGVFMYRATIPNKAAR